MIAAENLVGTLAALRDLHMLGDLLRQQIEADRVVAHHRLGHRRDGARQRVDRARGVDGNAFVPGGKALRDQIGIVEFVALKLADGLETDGESS